MTAVAIRRERTAIIVVHMASCARGGYVRPGQREGRGVVVEHPGSPRGDGMACCALRGRGWETRCDVIRNISADSSSALERRRVAAIAIRGIQCVVAVNVAGCARRRKVRTHERETRGAVIERRTTPTCGGVAVGAIPHRKSCAGRGMHRIVGSLPRSQMALRISAAIQGNL